MVEIRGAEQVGIGRLLAPWSGPAEAGILLVADRRVCAGTALDRARLLARHGYAVVVVGDETGGGEPEIAAVPGILRGAAALLVDGGRMTSDRVGVIGCGRHAEAALSFSRQSGEGVAACVVVGEAPRIERERIRGLEAAVLAVLASAETGGTARAGAALEQVAADADVNVLVDIHDDVTAITVWEGIGGGPRRVLAPSPVNPVPSTGIPGGESDRQRPGTVGAGRLRSRTHSQTGPADTRDRTW